MKRLLAMLLCLCLTVLLLASCSSDYTVEQYRELLDKHAEKAVAIEGITEITQLSGKTFVENSGDLVYFTATDNGYVRHTIFNVADNDVVLECANSDTTTYQIVFQPIYGNTFFRVNETMVPAVGETTYKTTLYDPLGEVVATADKISGITYSFDLFELDDTIYRVSLSGAVTVLKEKSAFNPPLRQFSAASEDYYYYLENGFSGTIDVSVYDKSLEFVSYWTLPFDADGCYMNVLSGGDVLVQAQRELPDDAADYDVYESGRKFDLHSYLVDPASGKADELELDYIVSQVIAGGLMSADGSKAMTIITDGIDNLAIASYIENNSINTRNTKIVVFGNDAKIKGDFLPEFKNMNGMDVIHIGEDLYNYQTKDGKVVICNSKGEILGYGDITDSGNECYFIEDNQIYNYKLEPVLDLNEEKLTVYHVFNKTVMLKDENGAYKLFANGELKTVSPAEGVFEIVNKGDSYYVVNDSTALSVYNENGDKITTLPNLALIGGIYELAYFDSGDILARGTDAATGLPVYYLLIAATEPVAD